MKIKVIEIECRKHQHNAWNMEIVTITIVGVSKAGLAIPE